MQKTCYRLAALLPPLLPAAVLLLHPLALPVLSLRALLPLPRLERASVSVGRLRRGLAAAPIYTATRLHGRQN